MGMIEALGEYLDLLPEPVGRMVGLAFDGADSDTVFGTLQPYLDEVGFYVSDEVRGWQAAVAESLGDGAGVGYHFTTTAEGRPPLGDWLATVTPPDGSEDFPGLLVVLGIPSLGDIFSVLGPIVGIALADQVLSLWGELAKALGLDQARVGSWTGSIPDANDPNQGGTFAMWLLSVAPQIVATILNVVYGLRTFIETRHNDLQPLGEALAAVGGEALAAGIAKLFHTYRLQTPGGGLQGLADGVAAATDIPPELDTDEVVLRFLVLAPEIG